MNSHYLDAHIHLWEYCLFHALPGLASSSCLEEIESVLRSHPHGEWRLGVNFNQESIAGKQIPDRFLLDRWFGDSPAVIVRSCLHLLIMNSQAMRRLGVYEENGLFLEADVFALLNRLLPELPLSPRDIIKNGWRQLQAQGYNRVIDMAMDKAKRGLFYKPDFYTVDWDLLDEALGYKIFLDGSLGARSAALRAPYSDSSGTCGSLNYLDEDLRRLIERVHQRGKPVSCHAIGDLAVAQFLRVIKDTRHPLDRLEHVQVATLAQLDELARLDIVVCIQPCASGELSWARQRVGDARLSTSYAWNLMRERGIRLLAGTDAPVDRVSPEYAAQLADSQKGAHYLDYQYVLDLFSQNNWDFYGWELGSTSQII
ncbi:MAG: amidohydrolase family protein [Syntrophomonadaceae bacterium]